MEYMATDFQADHLFGGGVMYTNTPGPVAYRLSIAMQPGTNVPTERWTYSGDACQVS
jgi:hypothetical protein